MVALRWRAVVATGLSLWLGVVACLLGCARPAMAAMGEGHASGAAAVEQGSAADAAVLRDAGLGVCPERERGADDSCCQHGHSDGSGKNKQHAKACCPTETALTQKNDLGAVALVALHVGVFTLVNGDAAERAGESESADGPAVRPTGREILRHVHVLRI